MTVPRILFMGAKDGVGTTTCVVNAALAWQQSDGASLICDSDAAHCGDVGSLFGTTRVRSAADVAAHARSLRGESLAGYCQIHPSGVGAVACHEAAEQAVADLLPIVANQYRAIFCDAGSRLTPLVAAFLAQTTHFVLVVRPELTILQAADRLLAQWRNIFVPRHRVLVLCNQWEPGGPLAPQFLRERLGVDRVVACPNHPAVLAGALHQGIPVAASDPSHPFVAALHAALREFIAATAGTDGGGVDLRRLPGTTHMCASTIDAPPEDFTLVQEIVHALQSEIDRRGIGRETQGTAASSTLRRVVEPIVVAIIDQLPPGRLADVDRSQLLKHVLDDAVGLGPLEPLLADPTVSEIMVNGPERVFVERAGRIAATSVTFSSNAHLLRIIERIVAPMGRRIDESVPMADARLPDGSRVHVIIPPLALEGPTLTIRRFPHRRLSLADLCDGGSLDAATAAHLTQLVAERRNMIISGGTGTGKTTLLNILASAIPATERIVTIEDAAELRLQQPHVVRLEARPPNVEGAGAVTIRELVRNALRMRPDRIVVGECRGGEALDMLQAMNTGHDGSLTTIHANSPRDCIARLETLVMFAGMDLPSRAIREQIAGAIHYVIQLERRADGTRRVSQVARVRGMAGDAVDLEKMQVRG